MAAGLAVIVTFRPNGTPMRRSGPLCRSEVAAGQNPGPVACPRAPPIGGEVHLGAAAHALVLRSSPWHTCGPSGIILGGLWVLGLLLSWLGLQGTGHLEGPWGRRTQASTRGASSDQGWSGVLLYVRAGPKGPGGEVPAPPSAAEWPENPE